VAEEFIKQLELQREESKEELIKSLEWCQKAISIFSWSLSFSFPKALAEVLKNVKDGYKIGEEIIDKYFSYLIKNFREQGYKVELENLQRRAHKQFARMMGKRV